MSYTISTTDSFVIKAEPARDSDISILLFTEQFGLIHAVAKSARQMRSKLRFALQSLSFSSISLVKGREVWRVTNTKKYISLYDKRLPIVYRTMFARIFAFIERFCPKEIVEAKIFNSIKQLSGFIFKREAEKKIIDLDIIRNIELIFMLKVLYELGYVKSEENISEFLDNPFSDKMLDGLTQQNEKNEDLIKEIKKTVERGIIESHL